MVLEHIHEELLGIHKDITPRNLVFLALDPAGDKDDRANVKIKVIDFGLFQKRFAKASDARKFEANTVYTKAGAASADFCAPELDED